MLGGDEKKLVARTKLQVGYLFPKRERLVAVVIGRRDDGDAHNQHNPTNHSLYYELSNTYTYYSAMIEIKATALSNIFRSLAVPPIVGPSGAIPKQFIITLLEQTFIIN